MKEWLVTYQTIGFSQNNYAKLNADKFSDALNRVNEVIAFLNEKNKEYNLQYKLVNVTPLESIESWND